MRETGRAERSVKDSLVRGLSGKGRPRRLPRTGRWGSVFTPGWGRERGSVRTGQKQGRSTDSQRGKKQKRRGSEEESGPCLFS